MVNAGTLDLAGYSVSAAGLSGAAGVVTNSGTNTVTLTVTGGAAMYSGTIADGAGRVALAVNGGMLTLAGTGNSYSAGTTVNNGTLDATVPQALGSGTVALAGGLLGLGDPAAFSGALTVSGGSLDNISGSAMTLSGNIPQLERRLHVRRQQPVEHRRRRGNAWVKRPGERGQ